MTVREHNDKSFPDKISSFSLVLIMVVLMIVGVAVLPLLDLGSSVERINKNLTVSYSWPGASPNVVETEVTSKIEGVLSAVNGVEEVSSMSRLGGGEVSLKLKKTANVPSVRFEVSSLLKRIRSRLPQGVSYPELSGGDTKGGSSRKETTKNLLSYRINADMEEGQIKEYIEQNVVPVVSAMKDVKAVYVSGGEGKYIEVNYDPQSLTRYGLDVSTLTEGIKSFIGKHDLVGEVNRVDDGANRRITLYLSTAQFEKSIGEIPLADVDGKVVYLNDLATYEYKNYLPSSYYRVNGLKTIYMNVYVDADANQVSLSKELRTGIDELKTKLRKGVYLTLSHDGAEEMQTELDKLVKRTLACLIILFVFVWFVRRSVKYLSIVAITLIANLLIGILGYVLFDLRLHIYSLAGIAVSFGLIIDSSIVMIDHYSYYRNRKAFLAILAALLTTVGSLVIVFFMPEYIQRDLYDFSWIIIINLTVALLVAFLFVPALVERIGYDSKREISKIRHSRRIILWTIWYRRYIAFVQKRRWVYIIIVVLAFGIPVFALPDKWGEGESKEWYKKSYDAVFGSRFFRNELKGPLSKALGGTMRLFAQSLGSDTYAEEKKDIVLTIKGQMPLGGSIHQLNEKVEILEKALAKYKEIKRFETRVEQWGTTTTVEFKKDFIKTGFPYVLENVVIGKMIDIGGADWSTFGVSERGFSNSLNLQNRSRRIEMTGYNYARLYRYAQEMCDTLAANNRVQDVVIEARGDDKQVEEFYMKFDKRKTALYGLAIDSVHHSLENLFHEVPLGYYKGKMMQSDLVLHSTQINKFDVWNLENSYINVGNRDILLSSFASLVKRESKNSIPKKNQEYVLTVAFNILGSYDYSNRYIEETMGSFNKKLPVGFHCQNAGYGWYQDDGTQYGLILLIVVIVFFLCAILFESLRQPVVIISLIPVSFIGTFLTFYISGANFGTGGFASLVLLCGLVVNAAIYIVNEYNNTRTANVSQTPLNCYVKAYNHKIIPVFLTILSTVLGLTPFFFDEGTDSFWFSFAIGTSGGLLFSIIALIFLMPILMPLKDGWRRSASSS